MTSFDRLPTWLQWLLMPGAWVLLLLAVWRTSLVLIASGGGLLVYLTLNYLAEMTWGLVATLGTAVIWLPLAMGYGLTGWIAVGTVPFALVRFWQCRRAGQPFGLLDPAQVLPDDTGDRLRTGKPLIRADFDAMQRQVEAGNKQAVTLVQTCGVCLAPCLGGVLIADHLGWTSTETNAKVFMLAFSTLAPILVIYRQRPELHCGACGRLGSNINLERLAESGLCPMCGKPGPITTRQPGPRAPAAWDDELA